MITESSDPMEVASPIGNRESGKNKEVQVNAGHTYQEDRGNIMEERKP